MKPVQLQAKVGGNELAQQLYERLRIYTERDTEANVGRPTRPTALRAAPERGTEAAVGRPTRRTELPTALRSRAAPRDQLPTVVVEKEKKLPTLA